MQTKSPVLHLIVPPVEPVRSPLNKKHVLGIHDEKEMLVINIKNSSVGIFGLTRALLRLERTMNLLCH